MLDEKDLLAFQGKTTSSELTVKENIDDIILLIYSLEEKVKKLKGQIEMVQNFFK